jgi:hypothetical protein
MWPKPPRCTFMGRWDVSTCYSSLCERICVRTPFDEGPYIHDPRCVHIRSLGAEEGLASDIHRDVCGIMCIEPPITVAGPTIDRRKKCPLLKAPSAIPTRWKGITTATICGPDQVAHQWKICLKSMTTVSASTTCGPDQIAHSWKICLLHPSSKPKAQNVSIAPSLQDGHTST